jgi:predicted thioesterase
MSSSLAGKTRVALCLGLVKQTAKQILPPFLAYGVASCLVKDLKRHQARINTGKKVENPILLNQISKQNPTPSFSFTTSIRESGGYRRPARARR